MGANLKTNSVQTTWIDKRNKSIMKVLKAYMPLLTLYNDSKFRVVQGLCVGLKMAQPMSINSQLIGEWHASTSSRETSV